MNIQELHNRLIKRAGIVQSKENSQPNLVRDFLMPAVGTTAGITAPMALGWDNKIDRLYDADEAQKIAERAKAFQKQRPNVNISDYTRRATRHLDNVRSKQHILKQMFSGSGKYKLGLSALLALGGTAGMQSLYDAANT